MILNKQKIEEAAENKYPLYLKDGTTYAGDANVDSKNGFQEGVAYAEKEMENLAIEFGKYAFNQANSANDETVIFKQMFDTFLKQRYEES